MSPRSRPASIRFGRIRRLAHRSVLSVADAESESPGSPSVAARPAGRPLPPSAGRSATALDVPEEHLLGELDLAGEQRADGLAAVDPDDRLGDQRSKRDDLDLGAALLLRDRDRIGDDDLSQRRCGDPLDRRLRKARRGWRRHTCSVTPSRCRASTIWMSVPAVSISSSTMMARLPRTSPMTLRTSARSWLPMRRFSTIARGASSSSAKVRARLAKPRSVTTTRFSSCFWTEVAGQQVDGRQLVDRDVEEALDLALVEVDGQEAVGPGHGQHVRDEASRDGDAGLVLLVGAAVAVVGHDGGDPPGAGALEGVDHDEQLHDRLVDRARGGLDQEDVLLPGVVDDPDEDVLVGELEDLGPAQVDAQVAADVPGQLRVGVPGVDVELVRWQGRSPGSRLPLTSGSPPSRRGLGCLRAPLSAKPPRCASPARKAAMPTTLSPALRRITITPRACDE